MSKLDCGLRLVDRTRATLMPFGRSPEGFRAFEIARVETTHASYNSLLSSSFPYLNAHDLLAMSSECSMRSYNCFQMIQSAYSNDIPGCVNCPTKHDPIQYPGLIILSDLTS